MGSQLKVRLQNTQILDGLSVNETNDEVVILLATVGSVHRLIFPHPKKLASTTPFYDSRTSHCGLSILHNFSINSLKDPRNYHVLPNHFVVGSSGTFRCPTASCSWLLGDKTAVFVLASGSGSFLIVRMSEDEQVATMELRDTTFINRLRGLVPSIIRPSNEGEDAAICLLAHSFFDDTLFFALCKDLKMRVWSYARQKCLLSINFGHDVSQELTGGTVILRRPLLRSACHEDVVYVASFVNIFDVRQFIIYRIDYHSQGVDVVRIATIFPEENEDVIDFRLFREDIICLSLDTKTDYRLKKTSFKE